VCGTSEEMIWRHYRNWMPSLDRGDGRRVAAVFGGGTRARLVPAKRCTGSKSQRDQYDWGRGESNPVSSLVHDAGDGSRRLFRPVGVVRVRTRRSPRQDFGRIVLPYLTGDIARGSILGPGGELAGPRRGIPLAVASDQIASAPGLTSAPGVTPARDLPWGGRAVEARIPKYGP